MDEICGLTGQSRGFPVCGHLTQNRHRRKANSFVKGILRLTLQAPVFVSLVPSLFSLAVLDTSTGVRTGRPVFRLQRH